MGFFSKTCAKTNLPVLALHPWGGVAPRLTKVVVLTPSGSRLVGDYDGYGMGLVDRGEDFGDCKFVLQSDYQGESFKDLPPSHDDPGQGFFFDDAFIEVLETSKGFATFKDYVRMRNDFNHQADQLQVDILMAYGHTDRETAWEARQILEDAQFDMPERALKTAKRFSWLSGLDEASLVALANRFAKERHEKLQPLARALYTQYGLASCST